MKECRNESEKKLNSIYHITIFATPIISQIMSLFLLVKRQYYDSFCVQRLFLTNLSTVIVENKSVLFDSCFNWFGRCVEK